MAGLKPRHRAVRARKRADNADDGRRPQTCGERRERGRAVAVERHVRVRRRRRAGAVARGRDLVAGEVRAVGPDRA